MKSCDENQNLMSTLLPLKIVRVPHIVASKISIRKEEYLNSCANIYLAGIRV